MPLSQDAATSTGEPANKKAKIGDAGEPGQQSSLFKFFSSSTKKKNAEESRAGNAIQSDNKPKLELKPIITEIPPSIDTNDVSAMVPKAVPPSSASWQSLYDKFVLIRKPRLKFKSGGENSPRPRQKVAAFDMDGTLFQWVSDSPGFWPSQLSHYELWNSNVITKMQQLYDDEDCLLAIFTNQGGIQGAHTGKKAGLLKAIIDWLESIVQRPLVVVASTKSLKNKKYADQSFHKPTPKMWEKVLVPYFGKKSAPFHASASFFVGDSADEDDAQGGVDKKFAENAGIGAFHTPEEYFGPSHKELRQRQAELGGGDGGDRATVPTIPKSAVEARKALLGGYHSLDGTRPSPMVILLVGVQGSGKSTFSRQVLFGNSVDNDNNNGSDMGYGANRNNLWTWLSQDTINDGKPGKREKVESRAREELDKGNSIILDRMHLDPEERETIINNTVTKHSDIPVHIVVFRPPKDLIKKRVRNRTNHPGKVEGEKGARMALSSIGRLVLPKYTELEGRVKLISCVSTELTANQLALRYHEYHTMDVVDTSDLGFQSAKNVPIVASSSKSAAISIPTISLGTMKVGRRICTETVQNLVRLGFRSIDTAPTYKNEDKIGDALRQASSRTDDVFLIAKIPKRAATKEQVQTEFERTLQQLNRKGVDLLLLHWPSDAIAQGTLREVWTCMEEFVKQQKCKALGVCNFNEGALMQLLRHCTIPPVLNQVERHPLLPQFELLEFCSRHNILLQAHTPFGGDQGKEEVLNHAVIGAVARETELSPAQVIVRWNLQQGVVVVTKCSQEKHAKEILSCTDDSNNAILSPRHMKALDALGDKKRKSPTIRSSALHVRIQSHLLLGRGNSAKVKELKI